LPRYGYRAGVGPRPDARGALQLLEDPAGRFGVALGRSRLAPGFFTGDGLLGLVFFTACSLTGVVSALFAERVRILRRTWWNTSKISFDFRQRKLVNSGCNEPSEPVSRAVDTELLRTFLEVRKTHHFAQAAEHLFVTPAAVSARIAQLEELVGQRLLTRGRNNVQLTPAGHRLVPHAEAMLDSWQRALQDSAGGEALLHLACLPSLREIFVDDWLLTLTARHPHRRIQLEARGGVDIVAGLRERTVDLGLLYEPPRTTDLAIEPLTAFDLCLVASQPDLSLKDGLDGHVHVDWGRSQSAARDTRLHALVRIRCRVDSAALARRLLLSSGGSAFLPAPLVADDLAAGRLHPVADSPRPRRCVFLIAMADEPKSAPFEELTAGLRALAGVPLSP